MEISFLQVLLLALLPALGNVAGGLLSELFPVSYRTLSLALHAATGVLFAVIGVELMPQALQAEPAWVVILAFVLGGVVFLLLDKTIDLINSRFSGKHKVDQEGDDHHSGGWSIFFATALDLFSDGLMIGTSATISAGLGLLLALGQVTADVPEGFATVAALKSQGFSRPKRLLASLAFLFPVLLGATIGYFLVLGQPEVLKYALLSLTAGILLTTVVEEIIPEAHKEEDARLATLMLVGGFALFCLVSVYFE